MNRRGGSPKARRKKNGRKQEGTEKDEGLRDGNENEKRNDEMSSKISQNNSMT